MPDDSSGGAIVLIVYLKWPIYVIQKPLDTNPGLPFTENSRSTYVSFENQKKKNLASEDTRLPFPFKELIKLWQN